MARIVQCDKKTGILPMRQENRDTPLYIKKYIMKIGIVSVIPHPDFCAGLLCVLLCNSLSKLVRGGEYTDLIGGPTDCRDSSRNRNVQHPLQPQQDGQTALVKIS